MRTRGTLLALGAFFFAFSVLAQDKKNEPKYLDPIDVEGAARSRPTRR